MPEFRFIQGQKYKCRNGVVLTFQHADADKGTFVFKDNAGYQISYDNKIGEHSGNPDLDIVELVREQPPVVAQQQQKETRSMKFATRLENLFSAPVGKNKSDNVRLSMMGIAVRGANDNFVVLQGDRLVDVADFVMDGNDMIYNLPVQQVAPGDLIAVEGGQLMFVLKTNDNGSVEGLNPFTSKIETYMPVENILFRQRFYVKVTSLLGVVGQGENANPMLAMALFGGDELGDKLPLLMMAQGGVAGQQINPMMLMALTGQGGGSGNMMEMMMMSQLFGGGGANPLAGLFGAPPAPPAK